MGKRARFWGSREVALCLLATTGCDCGVDTEGSGAVDGGSDDAAVADAESKDATKPHQDARIDECVPGTASCSNNKATYCRRDGTLAHYDCDPVQGLTCTASGCDGYCDLSQVEQSYIGCDYYPTITLNPVWTGFPFAIAVANASAEPTHVTITRGDTVVQEADVAANALQTFTLPWVPELKGGELTGGTAPACTVPPARGDSRLVADGAYRVRTNQPVTVYQFSPLQYELMDAPLCPTIMSQCQGSQLTQCYSYSNDASLLLPATALTGNYTALSWPSQSAGSGFIAVTAVEDGTQVQVVGKGAFAAGAGISSTGNGTAQLNRGDVLELVAAPNGDVSGTRVRANKPVQVISGHSCAFVPDANTLNCDHLEEVQFPEDTLGKKYVVPGVVYADGVSGSPSVVRIAAISDGTHVTFTPSDIHAPATLNAGEFVEVALAATRNMVVEGDQPLLVAQYMVGQQALQNPNGVGDPSQSAAVSVEQFRRDYLFTAPLTYAVNLATIIAEPGTDVVVDGQPIAESMFTEVGDYMVATITLGGDANMPNSAVHTVSANQKFGLIVYGYGLYTSYMYPGGADLARITIPILL
ncbi:MAG TPA: IgGFc-binding protein [Polyangiales bacterium]